MDSAVNWEEVKRRFDVDFCYLYGRFGKILGTLCYTRYEQIPSGKTVYAYGAAFVDKNDNNIGKEQGRILSFNRLMSALESPSLIGREANNYAVNVWRSLYKKEHFVSAPKLHFFEVGINEDKIATIKSARGKKI